MTTSPKTLDVNGIINSITGETQEKQERKFQATSPHPDIITNSVPKETLWNEFRIVLDSDSPVVGRKTYFIDNDIIDTINQCDFGAPNTAVVNAILRTFLTANISYLQMIEKKKLYPSILDKYAETARH